MCVCVCVCIPIQENNLRKISPAVLIQIFYNLYCFTTNVLMMSCWHIFSLQLQLILPSCKINQCQITTAQWEYIWISSVTQSCLTLCDLVNCSTPGLPVHPQLPEFIQTHVHWVSDAIQPSHPLSSPSPPALDLSQHQGLFQWASSSHQVAKVLEFQLQHQSFQWIPRTDFF